MEWLSTIKDYRLPLVEAVFIKVDKSLKKIKSSIKDIKRHDFFRGVFCL